MNLINYNLCDDWGWYVYIEGSTPVYQIRTDFVKIPCKKFNPHYNKLETIEEDDYDEYDYYINNQKNLDDISFKNIEPNNQDYVKKIFIVGSTIMITVLLTCFVFYMLFPLGGL
jgi:hypothetical protein